MACVAIKGATQGFITITIRAHTATAVVGHGDYAIDMRVFFQFARIGEVLGNGFSYGRRTIYGSENANIVAGTNFAINTLISLEGSTLINGHKFSRLGLFTETVVFFQIAHDTVVHVDVLARRNILA